MFNNYVNRHDLIRLIWGIRHGYLPVILSRFTKGKVGRVKQNWNSKKAKPSTWWMTPHVRRHCNYLVTGDQNIDYRQYVLRKYFPERKGLKGLCLGCGEGQKVLEWAKFGVFESIDAYDLSQNSIESAIKLSEKLGLNNIVKFQVKDIIDINFPMDSYDLIFVEHALHHFSNLETVLPKINQCLCPDGYFIMDEYVGPSRFQWTEKQLAISNAVRSILPEKYRAHVIDGTTNKKIIKPSRISMIMKDPSEAIESEKIIPLLHEVFNVIELKGYHGAITHLLFDGIAHNFLDSDNQTKRYINMCLEIEDSLTESEELNDDYAVVICTKK